MVSKRHPTTGANTPEPIEVVPLTLHIGAEIHDALARQIVRQHRLNDLLLPRGAACRSWGSPP